jgi:hypothetical protein
MDASQFQPTKGEPGISPNILAMLTSNLLRVQNQFLDDIRAADAMARPKHAVATTKRRPHFSFEGMPQDAVQQAGPFPAFNAHAARVETSVLPVMRKLPKTLGCLLSGEPA